MNPARSALRKIYAIVGHEIVFLRLQGEHAVRTAVPAGRLDLVPLSVMEPLSDGRKRMGIRAPNGQIRYLAGVAEKSDAFLTTSDPAKALPLKQELGWLHVAGADGKNQILSLHPRAAALHERPARLRRPLIHQHATDIAHFEDDFPEPLTGQFFQEHGGSRYYLTMSDAGVSLERDPAVKQPFTICGDHFREKLCAGYFLRTADEAWHLAAPTGEGPATVKKCTSPVQDGAARVQPICDGQRIAFRAIATHAPLIMRAVRAAGRDAYILEFTGNTSGATETGGDAPSLYFTFEPERATADFYFSLINEASGYALTAGDKTYPTKVACESWKQGEPRQLWRFVGPLLVSDNGLPLVAPSVRTSRAAVSLSEGRPKEDGALRLGLGMILSQGETGIFAVSEDMSVHQPVLASPDNNAPAQRWSVRPHQSTPRFGADRFSTVDGRLACAIFQEGTDLAWTRGTDGAVGLANYLGSATEPGPVTQHWHVSNGCVYDPSFENIVTVAAGGKLQCAPVGHGVLSFDDFRWGLTTDARIVHRQGSNRVVEAVDGGLAVAPYSLRPTRPQRWRLGPVAGKIPGTIEPLARTTVTSAEARYAAPQPPGTNEWDPHPTLKSALGYLPGRLGLMVLYSTIDRGMEMGFDDGQLLRTIESEERDPAELAAPPVIFAHQDSLFVVRVQKADHTVSVTEHHARYQQGRRNFLQIEPEHVMPHFRHTVPFHSTGSDAPAIVPNAPRGKIWLFARESHHSNFRLFQGQRTSAGFDFKEMGRDPLSPEDHQFNSQITELRHSGLWQGLMPAIALVGEKLFRLGLASRELYWDQLEIRGYRAWTTPVVTPLPAGIIAARGAPAVLVEEDYINVAFTAEDGAIWLARVHPGQGRFQRVRKIVGVPLAAPIHPSMVGIDGRVLLSFTGRDRQVHVIAVADTGTGRYAEFEMTVPHDIPTKGPGM